MSIPVKKVKLILLPDLAQGAQLHTFAQTGLPQAMSSATYDAANELTQWDGTNLTYDANGSLTRDGANTYTWNARNQLATVTDAGTGTTLASFQYDAFGRRTGNAAGNQVLYDGANAVQELSGTTPVVNRLTGGVDEFFARTDSSGTAFPLTDALGSTIALTDSSGAIQTQYAYAPFGAVTPSGTSSGNWYQFTGRVNDGTGLYYYRARYYSPRFKRFISEDPLGFGGGINLFAYTGNDPINFRDPFGFKPPSGPDSGNPGNAPGRPNPQPDQQPNPPNNKHPKFNSRDFRPHASEKNCQLLNDVENVGDALDLADTTSGLAGLFGEEEFPESSGPGFPSMGGPSYVVDAFVVHFDAGCK